nr:hypothetical protein [Klebsiella aerogenes]
MHAELEPYQQPFLPADLQIVTNRSIRHFLWCSPKKTPPLALHILFSGVALLLMNFLTSSLRQGAIMAAL